MYSLVESRPPSSQLVSEQGAFLNSSQKELAFCQNIPSHEKNPVSGDENSDFHISIPIPGISVFSGFFDQAQNKKSQRIEIPKKFHPKANFCKKKSLEINKLEYNKVLIIILKN